MHSDEESIYRAPARTRGRVRKSTREMLWLKTPSVGKLFNYLRYCGQGVGSGGGRKFGADR